ncbi:integrase, catalytic region, zinc finger, CCHC-type containing protein [Tanacetum coccineum]|uniref:Integrase, catalytic region, zinc finger, CCHC-type containing protein n=1 Tax=Tanacetum coccineum TaxID=301880 RepID=A0ABQ4YCI0_9ASTR
MERDFLSPKDKRGGRGVKEKEGGSAAGSGFVFFSDLKLGNDTRSLRTDGNKDGAIPSITVASGNTQEKNVGQSSTGSTLSSYANVAAISDRFANTAYDFFLGKRVAYPVVANYVRNTWSKYGLVRSMFSLSTGLFSFQFSSMDGLDAMLEDVWVKLHGVPVTAFSKDGLSAIATKLAMIELRADVELKDNIVVAMPKITGEGYYTCNIRIEYEWKPSRCACCKVFGHVQKECPKNIGAGEIKNLKKPSQTPKGIKVGQKVGFNHTKQVFQPVSKKPTSNGGNKKKYMEPTKETSTPSTTPTIEKIDRIGKLIIDWKVTLLDDEGKPLEKVISSGDYDSEDEVSSVDNEMASFLAKKNGYGTQSLLEQ